MSTVRANAQDSKGGRGGGPGGFPEGGGGGRPLEITGSKPLYGLSASRQLRTTFPIRASELKYVCDNWGYTGITNYTVMTHEMGKSYNLYYWYNICTLVGVVLTVIM